MYICALSNIRFQVCCPHKVPIRFQVPLHRQLLFPVTFTIHEMKKCSRTKFSKHSWAFTILVCTKTISSRLRSNRSNVFVNGNVLMKVGSWARRGGVYTFFVCHCVYMVITTMLARSSIRATRLGIRIPYIVCLDFHTPLNIIIKNLTRALYYVCYEGKWLRFVKDIMLTVKLYYRDVMSTEFQKFYIIVGLLSTPINLNSYSVSVLCHIWTWQSLFFQIKSCVLFSDL